jgi:hypothetical protein
MKKITVLAALIFLSSAGRAHAFIFTDVIAQVQRIQQLGQTMQSVWQLTTYRQEFQIYKETFDEYFQSFSYVYSRIAPEDWQYFVPTTWANLGDNYISYWQTFDEGAWQAQVVALLLNPLYATNPDYRAYADRLIRLSTEQVIRLKMEEASLIELRNQDQAHSDDLERFKIINEWLSVGYYEDGEEIPLGQQLALTNAILIKMASIQAETKVIEQALLTSQKEQRNLIMRMKQLEIETQNGNIENLESIHSITSEE